MGILDGLRGGFEKLEQRGDAALGQLRPLDAVRFFEDALRKLGSKDPGAAERLVGKLAAARRNFLQDKIAEAQRLAGDELLAEALETLEVADQNLTAGDDALRARIAALEREYRERLAANGAPGEGIELAAADAANLPPDAAGQVSAARSVGGELPPDEPAEGNESTEVAFEQFLSAMPEEDRERAQRASLEFKRGYVAHQVGDPQEALTAFERARLQAPADALVLEHLALVLDEEGRTDEARVCYERALAVEPQRHTARVALASIVSGVRASGGAQPFTAWQEAIADAAAAGVDPAPGLALLEEGLRSDAARAGAYLLAEVEIYLVAGRPAEALARIEQIGALGVAHPAMLHHLRAVALELSGALEEAQLAYDQGVRLGGHALFFRSEFAEFALRHRVGLAEAEGYIFDTCMTCQVNQPGEEELDYYGYLLTRIQHARGELRAALAGIDRLLAKGPPPILEKSLRTLRSEVAAGIAAQRRAEDELEAEDDVEAEERLEAEDDEGAEERAEARGRMDAEDDEQEERGDPDR